jgi:hypothetical protein
MNPSGSSSEGPFFWTQLSSSKKQQSVLRRFGDFFERKNIFFRICLAEGS